MKNIKTKVLVCCHKKDIFATENPYFPIQVGKETSKIDLGIQGDNTGENISNKNYCYCELTGLYWAWKNLNDVDIIGLCHYRRYFDFHNQCEAIKPHTSFSTSDFQKIDLSIPNEVLNKVANGFIVMTRPKSYRYNLMADYCICHISDDFRVLSQTIKETQPKDIQNAFFQVFYQKNMLRPCNMFLMNKSEFDEYCSWLFNLLENVEKKVDISNYSSSQKRIFGYMAERLLNVWVVSRKIPIISKPVIWFNDSDEPMKHMSPLHYACRATMDKCANYFAKYIHPDF